MSAARVIRAACAASVALALALRAAADVGPDTHAARCELGIIAAHDGDPARAESLFVSLLSASRRDARALTNLGNLALLGGDAELATVFYERAIAADSADAGIRLNRAIALTSLGHEAESAREVRSAVDLAGGVFAAGALLGLRPDSMQVEVGRGAAGTVLTKQEIWSLLRASVRRLPVDSTRVGGRSRRGAATGLGNRSAGPRAALVESAGTLYWKR